MTTTKTDQDKGFTIIEVVLVLAIAALIFLMIFIALPALQRGQANTARKQDIGVVASAVNTYRSNKSGALPTTDVEVRKYIDKLAQTDASSIFIVAGGGAPAANEENIDKRIEVHTKAKCDTTSTEAVPASGSKQAAVVGIVQVTATTYDTFCQDV